MGRLASDLRYAVRSLRQSPGFSLVAVVTLALGLGVSTAGFSLADWLLLRPVPGVSRPDRVAVVWNAFRSRVGTMPRWFSYAQYGQVAGRLPALSGVAGYQRGSVSLSSLGAEARQLDAQFVMSGFFNVLGVRPELGRGLGPDDDMGPAGQAVAVVSDRLWRGLWARDPEVLGRSVTINGRSFAVVGVAPPEFQGTDRLGQVDVWLPGRTQEGPRRGGYYEFVARLAPGATFDQAEAQLRAAMRSVQDTTRGPQGSEPGPFVFRGLGLFPLQRASLSAAMRLVIAACLAVLVVACANTANLLLFRGLMRRPSVALHRVLGAGGVDVARRSLAESLVLGVPATVLGLVFSAAFLRAFQGVNLTRGLTLPGGVGMPWSVLAFASGAGLMSIVLAGALPTYLAARTDAREAITGTSRSLAVGGLRMRRAFGAIQLAVSLSLLAGALLMVRSLRRLDAIALGFDPEGVVMLQTNPRQVGYSGPRLQSFYRDLLARINAAPGLGSAAVASQLPFQGGKTIFAVTPPGGAQGTDALHIRYNAVSSRYFNVLGLPLMAGRTFTDAEMFPEGTLAGRWFTDARQIPPEGRVPKVILSATAARRLFGEQAAVGQTMRVDQYQRPAQVVGVVGDSKWESIEGNEHQGPMSADPGMMLYGPFQQLFPGGTTIVVRSPLPAAAVAAAVRRIAQEVDPAVPIYGVNTLSSLIDQYLADRILFRKLLSGLAALAVVLAAVGLYGLIAFGVVARTRELGIRIALGAGRLNVVQAVLREARLVVSAGLGAGIFGGWVLGRLIRNKLYGVAGTDPASFALAALLLVAVSLAAAYIPARSATRVDPMLALRAE